MRPLTLKTLIISASVIILLIIAMQLAWLSRMYHLSARFTQADEDVLQEIKLWIGIGGIVLVTVLTAMGVLLYYFYRQRYTQEVQKDFLNNFMHEFKTPLSVMGIAGRVLLTPGIEHQRDRFRKYAAIIKEQSGELESKVNRILEAALSDRKEALLVKENVEVNEMIEHAISFLQPLISDKAAVVEFFPCPEPLRILADGTYVQQVIINLLDNSLKYASQPRISIKVSHNDKMCIITVKDNGIGIEKKYLKDIFRKFYRVPTGNVHNVKGFGIGLNFAKKVIDAHQGKITVQSEPGIGSEFSIHMPLI
ncbi:MAG: HAMP domain-containing sensor histidine kinase [Chitinophagaceae bacterium]